MDVKSARILIVEDDEDDYILTHDQLEKLDRHRFEIDWVTNLEDALEQLKRNDHEICLLDYHLGAYTGIDVLDKAQALGSHVPIIMLTGQSDDDLDRLALKAGAADFLVKGDITNARFTRAIRYAISRGEIEKARQQSLDAEIESRSKDRFIAHLSHELRTPLTSILGYTELLLNGDKAKDAQKELSTILNNGQHLLSLLNDILDLSKIAAGKLQLKPADVMLSSFVGDILTLMQMPANEKGLSLKFYSSPQVPEFINADPTRLRQVIINLLFNGIKFTDSGEVSLTVDFDPEHPEQIRFIVCDTGIGIAESEIDVIFIPFQQLEDVTLKREQGAGLGLAIATELIRRMEGEINVTSELGKGSEFTVSLKLPKQFRENLKPLNVKVSDLVATEQYAPLRGKILIVDDLLDIRQLVGEMCRSFGLEVFFAADGSQALEAIKQPDSAFDLVVMDIHMPVMDGRKAIVEIRNYGFSKPVLALTAANMKGVDIELTALGFDNIIGKPIDQSLLYQSIAKYLKHNAQGTKLKTEIANLTSSSKQTLSTVLVVEDDADSAELIVLLLDSLGINAQSASSCETCLKLIAQNELYSHILLDKNLPDGNGLNLATEISRIQPNCDLIIISGEEVSAEELRSHGISNSLLKPISLQQLQSVFS
ncbi:MULTISPECIES: hybrid sensor histidine kinase/response regulator [Alteromonadaceae]|uniref:hybrid sensor histidine kinase/response regulator n=1 Tax=Alteromonadaceae TaxID=72275 RepID=UPI001C08F058|nr:hybrid sensor histidine kinase/response regulator [Aliiglaciecola lipolytica]MBU2877100.1 response regulator [Aliiglaciecola lipolytica]